jgi:hypothetical protein
MIKSCITDSASCKTATDRAALVEHDRRHAITGKIAGGDQARDTRANNNAVNICHVSEVRERGE